MAVPQQRIFLSHSSKDHDFCVRLVDDLRRILGDDDAVWYDARGGLHGGDAWWHKIEQELNTRTTFVVVLSPDAVASAWVNDEIDIAWRRKNHPDPASRMRLIPLLLRPCTIRPSLESLQIVSFLPPKTYEAALQDILTALGLPSPLANSQKTPLVPQNRLSIRPEAIAALRTLIGHTSDVNSVALSADGLILASGSRDMTANLWDVQTGQLLRVLTGHSNEVREVALSADGLILASGSWDDTVKLWDTRTGQLLHTHTGYPVRSVALSADGLILASGIYNGRIELWNVQTDQHLHTLKGDAGAVYSVALSADGLILASGSEDNTVKLWSVQAGQLLCTLEGHTSSVYSVALSTDGLTLASGGDDNTIIIWGVKE